MNAENVNDSELTVSERIAELDARDARSHAMWRSVAADAAANKAPAGKTSTGEVRDSAGNIITHPNFEVAGNIATARDMVHVQGQNINRVAAWLIATTRGVVVDVEDAVKWIGGKL